MTKREAHRAAQRKYRLSEKGRRAQKAWRDANPESVRVDNARRIFSGAFYVRRVESPEHAAAINALVARKLDEFRAQQAAEREAWEEREGSRPSGLLAHVIEGSAPS